MLLLSKYTFQHLRTCRLVKELYQQLEQVIKAVLNKDILVVLGDWDAKVGPDATDNEQEKW